MLPSEGDYAVVVRGCVCGTDNADVGRVCLVAEVAVVDPDLCCVSCKVPIPSVVAAHTSLNSPDCYMPLEWLRKIEPKNEATIRSALLKEQA